MLMSIELQAEDKYVENDQIVIQYSASWCGPCRSLKKTIQDSNIVDAIKQKTKGWFQIDIESSDALSEKWTSIASPTSLPTVVKYKKVGNRWVEVKRFTGSKNAKFVHDWLMVE